MHAYITWIKECALAGWHHDPKSKQWGCPILHFSCYVNPQIPSPDSCLPMNYPLCHLSVSQIAFNILHHLGCLSKPYKQWVITLSHYQLQPGPSIFISYPKISSSNDRPLSCWGFVFASMPRVLFAAMPLMGLLCPHGRDDACGIWQLPCILAAQRGPVGRLGKGGNGWILGVKYKMEISRSKGGQNIRSLFFSLGPTHLK